MFTKEQLAQMTKRKSNSPDLAQLETIAARLADELKSLARGVAHHRDLTVDDERSATGYAESAVLLCGMLHATLHNGQKRRAAAPPTPLAQEYSGKAAPLAGTQRDLEAVELEPEPAVVVRVPPPIVAPFSVPDAPQTPPPMRVELPPPPPEPKISRPPPTTAETCRSCFIRAATLSCSACGVPTCEPCRVTSPRFEVLCSRCVAQHVSP